MARPRPPLQLQPLVRVPISAAPPGQAERALRQTGSAPRLSRATRSSSQRADLGERRMCRQGQHTSLVPNRNRNDVSLRSDPAIPLCRRTVRTAREVRTVPGRTRLLAERTFDAPRRQRSGRQPGSVLSVAGLRWHTSNRRNCRHLERRLRRSPRLPSVPSRRQAQRPPVRRFPFRHRRACPQKARLTRSEQRSERLAERSRQATPGR